MISSGGTGRSGGDWYAGKGPQSEAPAPVGNVGQVSAQQLKPSRRRQLQRQAPASQRLQRMGKGADCDPDTVDDQLGVLLPIAMESKLTCI